MERADKAYVSPDLIISGPQPMQFPAGYCKIRIFSLLIILGGRVDTLGKSMTALPNLEGRDLWNLRSFVSGKTGYIDGAGKWVIEPVFDQGHPFYGNRTAAMFQDRWVAVATFGGVVDEVTHVGRVVALIDIFGRMTPVEFEPRQLSSAIWCGCKFDN